MTDPEYKTLAELWEENEKRVIEITDGTIYELIQVVKDRAYLIKRGDNAAKPWESRLKVWQLYQEPEEKPAEKCEHKQESVVKVKKGSRIIYRCPSCHVELVEKWLWIYKSKAGDYCCSNYYYTEIEAKTNFGSDLVKKASNSRELFEVGE